MTQRRLAEDSTIYHYTLLYRFTRRHPFYWSYLACLILWLFVDAVYWRSTGLLLFAAAGLTVLLLHALTVLLLQRLSPGTVPRNWVWAFTFPIFGYLPSGYVPALSWNRANRHRLMIGFVLVAFLYVWLPIPWLVNAAAAHYFLLLPQLVYVGRCLRINRSGLIKVSPQDISLYKN